jgi:hypothetical protein
MIEEIKTISNTEIQKILEDSGFQIRSILEVVGKPKEHVEKTLKELLKKISDNSRIKLIKYEIEESQQIKDSTLFSTFAEIEFVCKSINDIMNYAVDYTPASIEVLHPSNMNVQASFMSDLMTELVGRIHLIDGEFRKIVAKNKHLSESLTTMIKNSILICLKEGTKDIDKISKIIGVDKEQTKIFLNALIKEQKIKLEGTQAEYSILT